MCLRSIAQLRVRPLLESDRLMLLKRLGRKTFAKFIRKRPFWSIYGLVVVEDPANNLVVSIPHFNFKNENLDISFKIIKRDVNDLL
jgi:hypothetical protein